MSSGQLFLVTGLPVFAVVTNILAGVLQTRSLHSRFTRLESTMNAGFDRIDARFASPDAILDRR
jgi:hypothetical protein